MNSDLMPSSESANSTNVQVQTQPELPTQQEPISSTETPTDEKITNRLQPIPPPSEPMQYRAIGLVRGRYTPTEEQITQGQLTTTDQSELNAVLLGRIMSLVKNHLDLEKEHLWVVYPRTGQEDGKLHLQIVGVWEPENLALQSKEEVPDPVAEVTESEAGATTEDSAIPAIQIEDGYFSVRGEVVYQSADSQSLVVKIKQVPRKASEKPKYFKLKLTGVLTTKAVGQFWDFHTKREGENLLIQQGESIAVLPQKPKTWKKKTRSTTPTGKRNMDAPRPVRKSGETTTPPVVKRKETKAPVAKPIKREKPPQ